MANQDQLEQLVDKVGLSAVLDMLAAVCEEKSEHLATNWQDHTAAKAWAKAAAISRKAESATRKLGL